MNRFSFGKGLVGALEDGDLEGDVATPVEQQETEVAAANAVTDVVEADAQVNEEAIGIESLSVAIEQAIDDVQEVESVVETVQDVAGEPAEGETPAEGAAEPEGLTEGEAQLAEEAFHQAMRRLGGTLAGKKHMPAMESFSSSNSRRAATRLAIEGVVDTIKGVWERIIQAIKTLWNKLVSFYKSFTDANLRLEKAAKAMKAKVAGIKTKEAKEGSFEDASLANAFPGGNIDGVNAVLKNHLDYIAAVESGVAAVSGMTGIVKSVMDDKEGKKTVAEAEKVMKEIVSYMLGGESAAVATGADGFEVESKKVLVGGKTIKVSGKFNFAEDASDVELAYSFHGGDEKSENKTVTVASVSDLSAVCDQVAAFAKANGKFVTGLDKQDKEVRKLLSAIDSLVAAFSKDGKPSKAGTFARKLVATCSNKVGAFGASMGGLNTKAGKAALSFVSRCASKY